MFCRRLFGLGLKQQSARLFICSYYEQIMKRVSMTVAKKKASPLGRCVKLQPRVSVLAVSLALSVILMPGAYAQTTTTAADDARADSATLPEVVVKARKPVSNAKVITADDLQQNAITDMAGVVDYEVLISAPSAIKGGAGATVWDGTGTTGYNIRGVEGNRVALDVDGIELPTSPPRPSSANNGMGASLGRDYIDPEMFQKIEISSGTTTTGSGAAGIGGRVAYVTKSPEDYLLGDKTSYYGAKLGYTSADKAWAEALTAAASIGDWKILGVYSRRDGEMTKANGVSTPNTGSWSSDALLMKLVYGGIEQHKIGLTLDMYERKDSDYYDIISAGGSTSTWAKGITQDSTTSRHRIELEDEFTPNGGYALFDKLRSYAYYQDSKKETNTRGAYGSTSTRYIDTYLQTTSVGLGADASKRLESHDLFYGLSVNLLDEKRPWTDTRYSATTGALLANYPYTKDYMAPTKTTKLVAYVRDEWHLSSRAILTPGVRAEYWRTQPGDLTNYAANLTSSLADIKSSNTKFWAPSLNFSYALTPSYDFYAQYSHGVRVPTASEKTGVYDSSSYTGTTSYYAIYGNPNLKNETSNAFELGTKGEVSNGVTLNTSLFYTKYKNFIDYVSIGGANYQMQNIADVDIWGGEISTRFDLGAYTSAMRGYSFAVGAGISEGTATNASGKSASANSVGPAKGTARLAYDDSDKRYGGALIMTSVKNKQANSSDTSEGTNSTHFMVPGYTTFDLSTYWKLARNVSLHAGIYNLTDKKYWEYAAVRSLLTSASNASTLFNRSAQPGRNFAVSLNVAM
jgi:hemoglobin/transferrin/lactoferrin receptor protein